MERDEDVVMSETKSVARTVEIPVDASVETSASASASASNGKPEHQTLLETFRAKVASPARLIREIEDHQAGISTPVNESLLGGSKMKTDVDSLMGEDSDWSVDHSDDTKALRHSALPTGLCYDIRMRYHCEVKPKSDVHPEDPRRIYYIYKELCKAGLVDDPDSSRPLAAQPLKRIAARDATKDEISTIHSTEHFEFVRSTQDLSEETLIALEESRDSIYFNTLTFTSALLSCGGAIETCKAVAAEKVKNAIAVIRPPGHHAEQDSAMGFCLFNNVCVAARACQDTFGEKCRKILILDWDVHHGNGIQKAFYNDPNILYISLHVYMDGSFYPGEDDANWDYCGEGNGLGKNVNIPWPTQGMGDGDYLYAFQELIMPIGYEFDPDLVIISAGFDAAAGDELGGCFVTPPCYAHMTRMLMNLAQGKVAVCLEGGYNFRSISKSALAVTRTLMGEPPDRLQATTASSPAVQTVRRVATIQSKYWNCLYPKGPSKKFQGNRLHDILRQYQAQQLYEELQLTSLYIYRSSISKSFENQVLASPNYDTADTLLVIFHDPPEMMGIPDPVTNVLEAHNCWLEYISWAVEKDMGVIDVNIPKHISNKQKTDGFETEGPDRGILSEQLALYLWENYIEPNDATNIFFMGIGDAFLGLANLLVNKERVHTKVSGVVCFVAENPVRAVTSNTTTWLSKWYRENSLIIVSERHSIWKNTAGKKPPKRYGWLVASKSNTLNDMMMLHRGYACQWMLDKIEEDSRGSSS
ncbi:Histone deacetylase hda1 [Myotisia sp. PD_48]|nr:Histone deacetylase hda1 [Myotisia sp. PD_48]